MHLGHPSQALRRLWWWVRGVTDDTYHLPCGRCGHHARIHLLSCGCRRFGKPLAKDMS
jgi:hypothetical protein